MCKRVLFIHLLLYFQVRCLEKSNYVISRLNFMGYIAHDFIYWNEYMGLIIRFKSKLYWYTA